MTTLGKQRFIAKSRSQHEMKLKSSWPHFDLEALLLYGGRETQEDHLARGKVISSLYEFVSTLKKQFYPLGYMQQDMMNLQIFRQGNGQSVQGYTKEFRKKGLVLGIPLYTEETLIKYIGGLHILF